MIREIFIVKIMTLPPTEPNCQKLPKIDKFSKLFFSSSAKEKLII